MKQSTPKVWVVNWAGHDYSPAKSFGELDFLTRGYVSLGSLDRLYYTITEAITDTKPTDFMLPAGFAILNVVAAAVWLHYHGVIKILVWDAKNDMYRELSFSKEQTDELIKKLSEEVRPA